MTVTTLNRNASTEAWMEPLIRRLAPLDDRYAYLVLNYMEGFLFNDTEARKLSGRKVVVLEMGEYGVDHSWQNTYLPAMRSDSHRPVCNVEENYKLDEYLRGQKIALCFKREFSRNIQAMIDRGEVHYPVEPIEIFFDNLPAIPEPNHDEYVGRYGTVFHLFGNSHPDRKALAGAMMARWERSCTSIPMQAALINHKLPFHHVEQVEHVSRYPVQTVLHHQGNCLLSVNLSGFGCKSFRNRESCFNAVPVMADYGIRYSLQWDDSNAVMLPTKDGRILVNESMAKLEEVLRDKENLWERMVNAHQMAVCYAPDNYVRGQINEKINAHL